MSPRLYLPSKCPYGVYEQYLSNRGLLAGSYICKHPNNAGCSCRVPPIREIVCDVLSAEEKAEITIKEEA